jgi:hypothetical protein
MTTPGIDAGATTLVTVSEIETGKHFLCGDTGDPGDCSGDFGGKTGGFCDRMSGPYPAADKHRARRDTVGVSTVGRQLVKRDVHTGAGHVIDRRMDACRFASTLAVHALQPPVLRGV